MFDVIYKFLLKTLSVDLARWLMGEAISTTGLNPLNPVVLMSRS
ncbi:MAG: hypothetical protein AAFR26_02890 [Cyanobacteria bacterium J06626_4]